MSDEPEDEEDFEDETRPAPARDAFYCPHCNTYAQQWWTTLVARRPGGSHEVFYEEADDGTSHQWIRGQCARCDRSTFWLAEQLIYPRANVLPVAHADMPASVLALYNEARAVAAVSRRAGAAMARATLETLLREKVPGATSKMKLVGLIDLATSKTSSGLGDLLEFIRVVGNSAVHVDEVADEATLLVMDETTTEAMEAIFDAINEVVDEFVTKPKKTKRFRSLMSDDVLKEVDARRAKPDQQPG